jgi:GC-rich sequence DNA-binding factor
MYYVFKADGKDFEEMDWFEMLALYGYDAESKEIQKNDDDVNLLPRVVEKTLVPKFLYFLGNVWDPMSRQQSNRVVSLVKKLSDEYPTVSMDSKPMQELLRAVVVKLKETVENDIFLPLYPKSLVENKSTGAFAFVERQFWSCLKLLGNISMWRGLIPDFTLHELCCDSLLNRYLVLSLQHTVCSHSETLYKCEKAVAALPEQWFEGIDGNKTIKPLETFCWFLGKFAGDVNRTSEDGRELDRKEAKMLLQRIAFLLARLNAIEGAEKLVEQYKLTPR